MKLFDRAISEERAELSDMKRLFEKYSQNWEVAMDMKEKKQLVNTCLITSNEMTSKSDINKWGGQKKKEIKRIKQCLADIKNSNEKKFGTIQKTIQSILDKNKIAR